jgi:dynein heavy chain
VLSVHNLDVTKSLLNTEVTSTSDFAWESQLRYYLNNDLTEVRILNAQLLFNYEYLGNTSRLVITPLTDRCYRTLCSAVHLNYGGAP